MPSDSQFRQLGQCLAGVFQNRHQALSEPAWFVHLKLWIYPTNLFLADSFTFFIEQASAAFNQPPYRQRVLRIRFDGGDLSAEYYALKQPETFQGAAQARDRLATLRETDLQPLPGSCLPITVNPYPDSVRYEARQFPGERCRFTAGGEEKLVELAFDAIAPISDSQTQPAFWMYDKGIDSATGKATWGAIHGPFQLVKVQDLSPQLDELQLS